MLRSGDGRARVRPWSYDPSVAQLTFIDHGVVPSSPVLQVWLGEMRAHGFSSVRTGAVTDAGADVLHRQGFTTLQTLSLLDLSLIGWRPPRSTRGPSTGADVASLARSGAIRSRRLRVRERDAAAAVDIAAFGAQWAIDRIGIDETCSATPTHRARTIDNSDADVDGDVDGDIVSRPLAGYAITGRADHHGYLQRLAVHPASQGRGVGLDLTIDSLTWMQRRRLTRAVVNTHTDNEVALALYQRVGFRVLPQGLSVLVRRLDGAP